MTGLVDRLRSALDEREQVQRDIIALLPDHDREALRTIQAHREILDRHEADSLNAEDPYCCWCSRSTTPADPAPDWPCPDVRSIAAIYLPGAES